MDIICRPLSLEEGGEAVKITTLNSRETGIGTDEKTKNQ